MLYYIADENNKIITFDKTKGALIESLSVRPQLKDLPIQKTSKGIVVFEGANYFEDDESYLALKAQREQERIQALSMTRSDFFDSTIRAWGADSDDLLTVVESTLNILDISEVEKKIAINNYKNALNFYRRHTLFSLLSGVPITIGDQTVQISSEKWDSFFDKTSKRDPDAYKELMNE